ncbi:DoxX-like protein [Micromonospora sp. A202]|uniref:DoxX family protein n=1 Tax=Micromonospora sp. A202 TaxID=2572899 RepID=UPI001151F86D|nr:DoxX family protein [Micromonospora sp. A202]TQJ25018.1 DoxX-like protein [Micromonospora sp. A202]
MEIAYWIVSGLLALFYLYSGGMKMVRSQAQLAPMMAWAGTAVPMAGVRAIGVAEVLGALGLILPPLTGIAPVLAVAAAAGLTILQVLGAGFHLSRGERKDVWLNLVLAAVAAIVTWLAVAL